MFLCEGKSADRRASWVYLILARCIGWPGCWCPLFSVQADPAVLSHSTWQIRECWAVSVVKSQPCTPKTCIWELQQQSWVLSDVRCSSTFFIMEICLERNAGWDYIVFGTARYFVCLKPSGCSIWKNQGHPWDVGHPAWELGSATQESFPQPAKAWSRG